MGKLLLIIGLLGLCHAAYSAAQHRLYLRLTEQEFSTLPLDIILQTLGSLLVTALGVINVVDLFKQIRIKSEWENKNWDNVSSRAAFYTFNHRGRYIYSNINTVKQESLGVQEHQQQAVDDLSGSSGDSSSDESSGPDEQVPLVKAN